MVIIMDLCIAGFADEARARARRPGDLRAPLHRRFCGEAPFGLDIMVTPVDVLIVCFPLEAHFLARRHGVHRGSLHRRLGG